MGSGGTQATNLGQGRRDEVLAQYILSGFGPCDRVTTENDYGIDLLAALSTPAGSVSHTSAAYAVQVKTGDEPFKYSGPQLHAWLSTYNLPILMCRVDKAASSIKLFSTWMLNCLVIGPDAQSFTAVDFVEEYGNPTDLRPPQVDASKVATVWMGPPILEIAIHDLANGVNLARLRATLREWVEADAKNYVRRLSDLPVMLGYTRWTPNELANAIWAKPYAFGPKHTENVIRILQECATVIALYYEGNVTEPIVGALSEFVRTYGMNVPDFTKDQLKIPR